MIGVGASVGTAWFTEQRTQEEALQSYLDQMGQLMTDEGLRESESGDAVRSLARARTLTVLDRLDGPRKVSVLRFLAQSELITKGEEEESSPITVPSDAYSEEGTLSEEAKQEVVEEMKERLAEKVRRGEMLIRGSSAVVSLHGANLRGVDAGGSEGRATTNPNLTGTDLSGADLSGADLSWVILSDTNLANTILSDADLSYTNMVRADLTAADLRGADLREADLTDANLKNARLEDTNANNAKAVTQDQLGQAKTK